MRTRESFKGKKLGKGHAIQNFVIGALNEKVDEVFDYFERRRCINCDHCGYNRILHHLTCMHPENKHLDVVVADLNCPHYESKGDLQ